MSHLADMILYNKGSDSLNQKQNQQHKHFEGDVITIVKKERKCKNKKKGKSRRTATTTTLSERASENNRRKSLSPDEMFSIILRPRDGRV